MKNILTRGNRPVLDRFARSNVLVALDYDGTLAPIVREPSRATMRRRTRRLLEEISSLYPCIVISGRSRADTLLRLEGVRVRGVVGNHGIEPSQSTPDSIDEVRQWLAVLEEQLSPHEGVRIEDKVFSVAIHYRRSRQKGKARAAILEAAASLGDVRILGGKQVVNILPDSASHKGAALERERERLKCDRAIYVGDDETDEDVFALDRPDRLLTIRVGASRTTMADYCIRSQTEIDRLMQALVDLRALEPDRQPRP